MEHALSERQLQPELQLPGCAQSIDAGADAYAVNVVASRIGPVDLSRRSSQQPVQSCGRQIEVCKVEEVVEAHAGLDFEAFTDRVVPGHLQVKRLQPGEVHL